MDTFNVVNLLNRSRGVNESLGTQALHALGVPAAGTTAAVPGFSQANQRFNYWVNTAGIANPSGDPYQLQIGVRYSFY